MMRRSHAILVLMVLATGLIFAVPNAYGAETEKPTQFKSYKNNNYGLSIEYPVGWNVQELIFEKDNWTGVVTFTEPKSSTTSFEILLVKNAIKSDKVQGQEYLDKMISEYKNQCVNAVADKDLYTCSKFNLISSASGNFQGGNLYSAIFSQDVTIFSMSLTQIVGVHEIPDGRDKWVLIITTNKADIQKFADVISHMEQSFKISDFTPQTSQTLLKTPSTTSQTTPTQATKYLLYENKKYGFSIKYPSNLQKEENIVTDDVIPNMLRIVSFGTPSGLTNIGVNLIQDDITYTGLSGQKFLDKMKDEFGNAVCSFATKSGADCSIEVLLEEGFTHKNGYDGYRGAYAITMSDNQQSSKMILLIMMYPDGKDVWAILGGALSGDELKSMGKELDKMTDSFTIYNYQGITKKTSQSSTKQTTQSSRITESSVGSLQINSGEFTVSKYSPAEVIVSGHVNSYERGTPLILEIIKPDKTSTEQKILVTKDGNFRAPLKVDYNWPAGNYQVLAKYGSQDLGSVSFLIKK